MYVFVQISESVNNGLIYFYKHWILYNFIKKNKNVIFFSTINRCYK